MGGGSPGLGWGASCCGVCLAVVCGVLLGCVLLWCDVVLYGRRNLTKNPSLKLSGIYIGRRSDNRHTENNVTMYIHPTIHKHTWTDRQTDRQTNRQTDGRTDRQTADRHTCSNKYT